MPEEHHRMGDDSFITVKREVPLWSLLTALVVVVAGGVSLQLGQSESTKRIAELSLQVQQLNANYASEMASKIELRFDVRQLEKRVAALEARMKP